MSVYAKSHLIRTRVIIVALIAIVLLGLYLWFSYKGSPDQIVASANKLRPDESWVLQNEHIVPPANQCFYGCPSVHRTYSLNYHLSLDELITVTRFGDTTLKALPDSDDCNKKNENNKIAESCTLEGDVDGYVVTLYYNSIEPYTEDGEINGDPAYSNFSKIEYFLGPMKTTNRS